MTETFFNICAFKDHLIPVLLYGIPLRRSVVIPLLLCYNHSLKCNKFAEQRIAQIKEANSHLEAIIRQKDALIGRLQKPLVNDFLRVEASYQQ